MQCDVKHVELPCSASGSPSPVVTINEKGSGLFSTSSLLSVTYREVITEPGGRNYMCSASNRYGTVTADCLIHIGSKSHASKLERS